MATFVRSRLLPQCSECMRAYALGSRLERRHAVGSIEHVRGKKKSTRGPPTIPVRLLKDLRGYGKKGAIVPLSPGQMRNEFYHTGKAEYITGSELRDLRKLDTPIERDSTFLVGPAHPAPQKRDDTPDETLASASPTKVRIFSITPQRRTELLELFVPIQLEFFREIIPEVEEEQEAEVQAESALDPTARPQGGTAFDIFEVRAEAVKEAREAQEQARLEAKRNAPKAIYGSVSIQDVHKNIKALLAAGNEESARVSLHETDLSFVATGDQEDTTKIKHTGTYELRIKVRGTEDVLSRTVRVLAQQEQEP